MSGTKLCGLLGELGFEGHEKLDADSFEWPFQYDDARPILDWLCSNLRPSNVLSPTEVSQLRFLSFFNLLLNLLFFRIFRVFAWNKMCFDLMSISC